VFISSQNIDKFFYPSLYTQLDICHKSTKMIKEIRMPQTRTMWRVAFL